MRYEMRYDVSSARPPLNWAPAQHASAPPAALLLPGTPILEESLHKHVVHNSQQQDFLGRSGNRPAPTAPALSGNFEPQDSTALICHFSSR